MKWRDQLKVRLPDPLPFDGVKVTKARPPRYVSAINPRVLFLAARRELAKSDPSAYLVILLALGAGLRKNEIDGLQWTDFDFGNARMTIRTNEFRDVKTDDSEATIELDRALAKEIQSFMVASTSTFVIESHLPARPGLDRQYYRAKPVFEIVNQWLRKKGITARNPLHTLRKECGSLITQEFGIYAAKTMLRHANIATTAASYTSNKERIAIPFGRNPLVYLKEPLCQFLCLFQILPFQQVLYQYFQF